jgi:hypothetical protein
MKLFAFVLAMTLLIGSGAVFADTESHEEITTGAGTKITKDAVTKDSVGWTGTRKIEGESETVIDPKGLMNKTTESSQLGTVAAKLG